MPHVPLQLTWPVARTLRDMRPLAREYRARDAIDAVHYRACSRYRVHCEGWVWRSREIEDGFVVEFQMGAGLFVVTSVSDALPEDAFDYQGVFVQFGDAPPEERRRHPLDEAGHFRRCELTELLADTVLSSLALRAGHPVVPEWADPDGWDGVADRHYRFEVDLLMMIRDLRTLHTLVTEDGSTSARRGYRSDAHWRLAPRSKDDDARILYRARPADGWTAYGMGDGADAGAAERLSSGPAVGRDPAWIGEARATIGHERHAGDAYARMIASSVRTLADLRLEGERLAESWQWFALDDVDEARSDPGWPHLGRNPWVRETRTGPVDPAAGKPMVTAVLHAADACSPMRAIPLVTGRSGCAEARRHADGKVLPGLWSGPESLAGLALMSRAGTGGAAWASPN